MNLFLKKSDIKELTGYVLYKKQIAWLQLNGVKHWVRADGKPCVPVSAITSTEPDIEEQQPNLAFLLKKA